MKRIILGYATCQGLDGMTPESARQLTHINLAFGIIQEGLLSMEQLPGLKERMARIRSFNPEIKFVLSVGGWKAGGFSIMSRTKDGRDAFARSVQEAMDEYQLDGVDIDWEYPCNDAAGIDCDPSDKENFTHLLQALRDAVGNERIVSIAAGGGDYFIRDTQMDQVARICDYIQIMTYDFNQNDHLTRHHTGLYAMKGSRADHNAHYCTYLFHNAGVPLEKIVLGAAFYSRRWYGVPAQDNGLLQHAETMATFGHTFEELKEKYINKNGFIRYWDETARAPYLIDGHDFISYDDEQSVAEKCAYVKQHGLLGLMYWEHSCDPEGTLLDIIAKEMK